MGFSIHGAGAARQSIAQNPQFTTMSTVRKRKLDASHLRTNEVAQAFRSHRGDDQVPPILEVF